MKKDIEVYLELEDIDEFLSSERDFALPFLMTLENNSLFIELYSDAQEIADQFLNLCPSDPFSRQSFVLLDKLFTPYIQKHGYKKDNYGIYRYYLSFIKTDPLCPSEQKRILDNTFKIDTVEDSTENLTGLWADDCKQLPKDSFVTVENGKIVSVATVNDHHPDSNVVEITVKTAKQYRGKGYGASNVLALCQSLLDQGKKVGYCCSKNNSPSIKLAKGCGFIETGKSYAVCGYKD